MVENSKIKKFRWWTPLTEGSFYKNAVSNSVEQAGLIIGTPAKALATETRKTVYVVAGIGAAAAVAYFLIKGKI